MKEKKSVFVVVGIMAHIFNFLLVYGNLIQQRDEDIDFLPSQLLILDFQESGNYISNPNFKFSPNSPNKRARRSLPEELVLTREGIGDATKYRWL